MLMRILRADLRRNRLVATALTLLIALVTALSACGTLISAHTLHTIRSFFTASAVPNVVQMHKGPLNPTLITEWASQRTDVLDHQIIATLPIPGQALWINGVRQDDSVLEPAAVTAPTRFDFLLDENSQPIDPQPGQIALPVHYLAAGAASLGDEVRIQTGSAQLNLRVSHFLRDAQMNPSLVTSKRMLLHPQDYSTLQEHYAPEYLIEFRLAEGTSPTDFIDAYTAAGLPAEGIAVTDSIFWLMNGLSTFVLAAICLLAAALLSVVALIALRVSVLSSLDNEIAPLAVLSVIGTPAATLRCLFLVKYVAMACVGAMLGTAIAYPLSRILTTSVTLYFGHTPANTLTLLSPLLVGVSVVALTSMFCLHLLRGIRRHSSAELLRMGTQGRSAHKASPHPPHSGANTANTRQRTSPLLRSPFSPLTWLTIRALCSATSVMLCLVVTGASLTALLPSAVAATINDARFATYLGIGPADLRIDLRAEHNGEHAFEQDEATTRLLQRVLNEEKGIATFAIYQSYGVEVARPGRRPESLVVEVGDHLAFPLPYMDGHAPHEDSQIALSYSAARDLDITVGETLSLTDSEKTRHFHVSGIYQDLTNGGRSGKTRQPLAGNPLWQVAYATLKPDGTVRPHTAATTLAQRIPHAKVTDIAGYIAQTMGALHSQLHLVTLVTTLSALGVIGLITHLVTLLILVREKHDVDVLIRIGVSPSSVRRTYLMRTSVLGLIGTLAALILTYTGGQTLISGAFGVLGAPAIQLRANPWLTSLVIPLAVSFTVWAATRSALHIHPGGGKTPTNATLTSTHKRGGSHD